MKPNLTIDKTIKKLKEGFYFSSQFRAFLEDSFLKEIRLNGVSRLDSTPAIEEWEKDIHSGSDTNLMIHLRRFWTSIDHANSFFRKQIKSFLQK